jgi:recombination protein RecA
LVIKGKNMAKKQTVDETILKNLKGFCKKGAGFSSPGNIPTGHFALDFAIQYGMDPLKIDLSSLSQYDPSKKMGLPLGKLVEIFGEEGGGKSSIAYRAAGYAQKMGHMVAWIDTEHSFSPSLAQINGCNPDDLIYSNLVNADDPDKDFHGEDVIDKICKMCEVGIKVIVLDSVANLIPKARHEAGAEQKFMGLLSRLLSDNMGKVVGYAEKYGTLLLFINQLREKIGMQWGDPETSPGGHSLKHNASLRIKISKKNSKDADIYVFDENDEEKRLIGRYANVRIMKSRLAPPFTQTLQIPVYYKSYFPDIEEIAFDTGRQVRLITVLKEVYKWNDLRLEGRMNFIKAVKDNGLIDELIKDVKQKAEEKNVILPPELIQYKIGGKKLEKVVDDNAVGKPVQRGRPKKNS